MELIAFFVFLTIAVIVVNADEVAKIIRAIRGGKE
jgi:hypothetical protein